MRLVLVSLALDMSLQDPEYKGIEKENLILDFQFSLRYYNGCSKSYMPFFAL